MQWGCGWQGWPWQADETPEQQMAREWAEFEPTANEWWTTQELGKGKGQELALERDRQVALVLRGKGKEGKGKGKEGKGKKGKGKTGQEEDEEAQTCCCMHQLLLLLLLLLWTARTFRLWTA